MGALRHLDSWDQRPDAGQPGAASRARVGTTDGSGERDNVRPAESFHGTLSLFEPKRRHTEKQGLECSGRGQRDVPSTHWVSKAAGCLPSMMKADVCVSPESTNGSPNPKGGALGRGPPGGDETQRGASVNGVSSRVRRHPRELPQPPGGEDPREDAIYTPDKGRHQTPRLLPPPCPASSPCSCEQ